MKKFTDNVCYFHSQRSQGHGLNVLKNENDVPQDTKLLIAVDSSTNDEEMCMKINNLGMDIIVIDHHIQDNENKYALIVNPQQKNCKYPNKNSCGSQIVWKVCQVLDDYYKTDYAEDFMDLCAIGLIGDVMSLKEMENRYLVREGLSNIHNEGIKFLLQHLKIDISGLTATNISYSITPCLNACCRLDKLEVGMELLTSDNSFKTMSIVDKVYKMNEERKVIQKSHLDRLLPDTIEKVEKGNNHIIVVDNKIGAGYRGLVANDICNILNVPVMIVASTSNEICKGSFRVGNDYDLRSFLKYCSEIIYAAGHDSVGGLSFRLEDSINVEQYFQSNFEQRKEPFIEYVYEIDVSDLNEDFIRDVERFYNISGKGFETGNFKITGLQLSKKETIGKLKNTVKLTDKNTGVKLLKFRTNEDYIDESALGKKIEVVGKLNLNQYKDSTTMQVLIEDYRLVD